MPQQRQSWHQTQKDPKLQYYSQFDPSLQVVLPWGISCRLSVSSHLWQLRKRLASSLPSSYYWEVLTGSWDGNEAVEPGGRLVCRGWSLHPCSWQPTQDKGQKELPRRGYFMAICSFSKDSGGHPLGGPGLHRAKAILEGEKPGRAQADRTQWISDLGSLTPFLPQVSCHCSLALPPHRSFCASVVLSEGSRRSKEEETTRRKPSSQQGKRRLWGPEPEEHRPAVSVHRPSTSGP